MRASPLICVVDDDESVRDSLSGLLRSVGFSVRTWASADEYLRHADLDEADCLLLDVKMPGTTGPELQRELAARGFDTPIVFLSAQADDTLRARVLERGATAFLAKPFFDEHLLSAVRLALRGRSGR